VIMKIDLVGPARRGLAMGLNEFAGYVAVSLAALASGYIAATYALRPQPFYLGLHSRCSVCCFRCSSYAIRAGMRARKPRYSGRAFRRVKPVSHYSERFS